MATLVEEHVLYRIFNAPVREYPYPHIYVENIFPDDFYAELRANWPDSAAFKPLAVVAGTYVNKADDVQKAVAAAFKTGKPHLLEIEIEGKR